MFVLGLSTQPQITTRASVASDGGHDVLDSGNPAISADGRFVAFLSRTAAGSGDNEVFVHDRVTGATTSVGMSSVRDFTPSVSSFGSPDELPVRESGASSARFSG